MVVKVLPPEVTVAASSEVEIGVPETVVEPVVVVIVLPSVVMRPTRGRTVAPEPEPEAPVAPATPAEVPLPDATTAVAVEAADERTLTADAPVLDAPVLDATPEEEELLLVMYSVACQLCGLDAR